MSQVTKTIDFRELAVQIIILAIVTLAAKLYINFKPFWDVQKKSKHCNFAIFKLFGCNEYNAFEMFTKVLNGFETYWLGSRFFMIIDDPDDVKTVLNSDEAFEKAFVWKLFFKYGLVVENKENYKFHRKLLNPIFKNSILQTYTPKLNSVMDKILDSCNFNTSTIDIRDMVFIYGSRGVIETLFCGAVDKEYSDECFKRNRRHADRFVNIPTTRVFNPWLQSDFIFKRTKLHQEQQMLMKKIFEENMEVDYDKIKMYQRKMDPNQMSFFDCMIQYKMTRENFIETSISFVGASVDTTTSTLTNTLLLLGMFPVIQEKLYNEVKSVLGTSRDRVTEAEIAQMPYLDCIIKETLRVLPVGPVLFRETSAPLKLKRFTVPANTVLHIKAYELHHDERFWGKDIHQFNPDRFEPEKFKKVHPYAYIPFSNGPRICPGYKYAFLSMKIFLSRMIMEYKVSTDIKYEDIRFNLGLIMKIQNTPLLTLEKRLPGSQI